jgi:hypothetical protein
MVRRQLPAATIASHRVMTAAVLWDRAGGQGFFSELGTLCLP